MLSLFIWPKLIILSGFYCTVYCFNAKTVVIIWRQALRWEVYKPWKCEKVKKKPSKTDFMFGWSSYFYRTKRNSVKVRDRKGSANANLWIGPFSFAFKRFIYFSYPIYVWLRCRLRLLPTSYVNSVALNNRLLTSKRQNNLLIVERDTLLRVRS